MESKTKSISLKPIGCLLCKIEFKCVNKYLKHKLGGSTLILQISRADLDTSDWCIDSHASEILLEIYLLEKLYKFSHEGTREPFA